VVTTSSTPSSGRVDLVVVGAGITGLAAAWEATRAGASVVVLDPDPPGGKVRASPFAGGVLDEAADAFLARVPEGLELCRELGIDGDLVSPAARTARVWSRGELRPLPSAQVLGVPTDLDELAASGIVSAEGLARAADDLERPLQAPDGDPTIGAVIRDRLGDEVLERLVDPLVGGINAGDCDALSLAATVPQLDAAVRSGADSLIEACAAQRAAAPDPTAPVFFAPRDGMGSLVDTLVDALADLGTDVRPWSAQGLSPDGDGWSVATDHGDLPARAAALTAPAGAVAALVEPHAPQAAAELSSIGYASVALLSIATAREAVERDLDASGFLVPRVEGLTITACSWSSAKWAHLGGDGTVRLRASVGRAGHDGALGMSDPELVAAVLADLAATMDLRGRPDEVRVSRWTASLPQYRPGHLDRVAAVEANLARVEPRLGASGAWARGLGVPACIRQGRALASTLLQHRP
jgi:protoporphyrinogen/coproporphyrinogen III oxidase